jgi:Mrp family chromosome partitioning ATPase
MTDSAPTASNPEPRGTVVTFYSYKGGVGRSMAVANIAWLLASTYGKRVVVVDWDLEAPGLHRFFGIEDEELGPGLIDYLTSYRDALRQPERRFPEATILIDKYLRPIESFASGGSLRLMSAGDHKDRTSYVRKVRDFDWKGFYDNWGGAQLIEAMRVQFSQQADITLIDSRTGLTDIGGVCTVQLPDTVVFVFVFNSQNLKGIETVASDLHNRENETLLALNRWPTLHFLSSRKELSEQQNLRDWEARADQAFQRFCDSPSIEAKYGKRTIDYLRALSVPYVPYFAYGEELAAKTDLGLEICNALRPMIELLLLDATNAEERAGDRAEKTRIRLNDRLSVVVGSFALIGLLAVGVGAYLFWQDVSIKSFFVRIAGDSPLGQLIATAIIGALSGIAGGLALVSPLERTSLVEPRRFRKLAMLKALFGAMAGVAFAVALQTNHFFPLFSLFGPLVVGAALEGLSRSAPRAKG